MATVSPSQGAGETWVTSGARARPGGRGSAHAAISWNTVSFWRGRCLWFGEARDFPSAGEGQAFLTQGLAQWPLAMWGRV